MIFAWDDLRRLHLQRMGMAREELCHRLQAYQDSTGERVVVVFDGKREDAEPGRLPEQVQVIYSKREGTADGIIERLACKYAGDHDLTVASRDRAVLDMVSSFGAHAISAQGLADRLESAERQFREGLGKYFAEGS